MRPVPPSGPPVLDTLKWAAELPQRHTGLHDPGGASGMDRLAHAGLLEVGC